jgi:sugar lactone lactonase YvrE
MALNPQLPPIFDGKPEAIAPAEIVAEFPVNTFLENIAIAQDGTIFITSYEEGKIYRLKPGEEHHDFAKIEGNLAGMAIQPNGNILVAGALKGGTSNIWQIQPNGSMEVLVALPDAILLNGMTHLQGDIYLVADSYKGVIWAVDAIAKTAEIWVQDPLLARSDSNHPFPAVNGIKIYQKALFASNTQRQLLIRIPLEDNAKPGTPEEFLNNVNLDDFAFDIDGNLYGTTHVYNSAIRITPQKEITTIAKAEQGMTGNTAVAFGCTSNDKTCIYITTNGGMSLPPSTGLEPAKVVRLEVGVAGA